MKKLNHWFVRGPIFFLVFVLILFAYKFVQRTNINNYVSPNNDKELLEVDEDVGFKSIEPSQVTIKKKLSKNLYIVKVGGDKYETYEPDNGRWGITDGNLNVILPIKYDLIIEDDGLIFYYQIIDSEKSEHLLCGLLDNKGRALTPPIYEGRDWYDLYKMSEGYIWLKKDSFWGLLDTNGNVILDFEHKYIQHQPDYYRWGNPIVKEGYTTLHNKIIDIRQKKEYLLEGYAIQTDMRCGCILIKNLESGRYYIYNFEKKETVLSSINFQTFGDCLFIYSNKEKIDRECGRFYFDKNKELAVMNNRGEIIIEQGRFKCFEYDIYDKIIKAYYEPTFYCGSANRLCDCSIEGDFTKFNLDGELIRE